MALLVFYVIMFLMSTRIKNITQKVKINISLDQLREIFNLSNYIIDFIEDFLEDQSQYKKEFLKGIRKSQEEFKKGKGIKIKHLSDLL